MLPSKEFPFEMGVAYSLELFLQLIPNLFCQVFNNTETPGDLTKIQSAALAMKLICLIINGSGVHVTYCRKAKCLIKSIFWLQF